MAITSYNKIFQTEDQEYAYAAEPFYPPSAGGTAPLYVPKIMGSGACKAIETINASGIFDNASECKPSYMKKIHKVAKFYPVLKSNCIWRDTPLLPDGRVPKGTPFIVEFVNGNISSPYFTTK